MASKEKIKKELTLYGKKIVKKGLVVAGGGNISARWNDIIYLSPSGFALDEISQEQWVGMDLKTGKIINPDLKPTCEFGMHLACYRSREDIRAVVHTHPPYVVGLTSAGIEIEPMFPDFIAYLGKKVPLLDYIVPAGEKLAETIKRVIDEYDAVSLKNHGALTVGAHLKEAFYRSIVLEEAAKILFISRATGTPHILTPEEAEEIENLPAENHRRKILKELGTSSKG